MGAHGAPTNLLVWENTGAFSFAAAVPVDSGVVQEPTFGILDVDRDGDLDIVAANSRPLSGAPDPIVWLANEGALSFAPPADLAGPDDIVVRRFLPVELNGDGELDVLVVTGDRSVFVAESIVQSGMPPFSDVLLEVTAGVRDLADVCALDVDDDGDLDIVASSTTSGLVVSRNRGFDRYDLPVPFLANVDRARDMTPIDIDADGDLDLLFLNGVYRLILARNMGGGSFVQTTVEGSVALLRDRPITADFDGDGDVDIVARAQNGAIFIYDQLAPGQFALARLAASGIEAALQLVADDLDADGTVDLVMVAEQPNGQTPPNFRIRWLRGTGAGDFVDAGALAGGLDEIGGIATPRLSSLAFPDIVWGNVLDREVDGLAATGGGSYSPFTNTSPTAGRPMDILAGPLVGAASPGLLVCSTFANAATPDVIDWLPIAFPGLGTPERVMDGVQDCVALRLADIDGDGDEDLLLATRDDRRIGWLRNESAPAFGVNYCGPAVPSSVGVPAEIDAVGSDSVSLNDFTLRARNLAPGSSLVFLASQAPGMTPLAGGGIGTLCLGGAIGRFVGPGQVQPANADGVGVLQVNLSMLPQPTGAVAATFGSLWFFQAWFRDTSGGVPSSNFTDGLAVVFR